MQLQAGQKKPLTHQAELRGRDRGEAVETWKSELTASLGELSETTDGLAVEHNVWDGRPTGVFPIDLSIHDPKCVAKFLSFYAPGAAWKGVDLSLHQITIWMIVFGLWSASPALSADLAL